METLTFAAIMDALSAHAATHPHPSRDIEDAVRFFYGNAGYSYDPATETKEAGRLRCAVRLAMAEAVYLVAHREGLASCEWADDPSGWSDIALDRRMGYRAEEVSDPEAVESCAILDRHGRCLASLYGIEDAGGAFRRVVRAELALECEDELRAMLAAMEA